MFVLTPHGFFTSSGLIAITVGFLEIGVIHEATTLMLRLARDSKSTAGRVAVSIVGLGVTNYLLSNPLIFFLAFFTCSRLICILILSLLSMFKF